MFFLMVSMTFPATTRIRSERRDDPLGVLLQARDSALREDHGQVFLGLYDWEPAPEPGPKLLYDLERLCPPSRLSVYVPAHLLGPGLGHVSDVEVRLSCITTIARGGSEMIVDSTPNNRLRHLRYRSRPAMLNTDGIG